MRVEDGPEYSSISYSPHAANKGIQSIQSIDNIIIIRKKKNPDGA